MESVEIIQGGFLELEAGAKGKRSVKRRSPSKKSKPKRRTSSKRKSASKKRRSASKAITRADLENYADGGCLRKGSALQEQAYFLASKYTLMTGINQDQTVVFDHNVEVLKEDIAHYKKAIAKGVQMGVKEPTDAEVRSYAQWYRGCPSNYQPKIGTRKQPY